MLSTKKKKQWQGPPGAIANRFVQALVLTKEKKEKKSRKLSVRLQPKSKGEMEILQNKETILEIIWKTASAWTSFKA